MHLFWQMLGFGQCPECRACGLAGKDLHYPMSLLLASHPDRAIAAGKAVLMLPPMCYMVFCVLPQALGSMEMGTKLFSAEV